MNYITLLNRFWSLNREYCFNPSEIALYFHLVNVSNSLGWKNPFKEGNVSICASIGISEPTIQRSRERLIKAELITFKSGKVKRELTEYTLIEGKCLGENLGKNNLHPIITPSIHQSEHLSSTLNVTQPFTQASDFNKQKQETKLKPKKEEELSPGGDPPLPPGIKNAKLFPEMVAAYDAFIKKQTGGAGAKMNAVEGQAMKQIIEYWRKNSIDTSDEGILKSWNYMLKQWDNLELFYQGKLKLTEINSNLVNIINQIKNPKVTKKTAVVGSSEKSQTHEGNFYEKRR